MRRADGLAVAILANPARAEEAVPQFQTLFSLLAVLSCEYNKRL
jgi:hypothetical protein